MFRRKKKAAADEEGAAVEGETEDAAADVIEKPEHGEAPEPAAGADTGKDGALTPFD